MAAITGGLRSHWDFALVAAIITVAATTVVLVTLAILVVLATPAGLAVPVTPAAAVGLITDTYWLVGLNSPG
jgi:hypothetical protein